MPGRRAWPAAPDVDGDAQRRLRQLRLRPLDRHGAGQGIVFPYPHFRHGGTLTVTAGRRLGTLPHGRNETGSTESCSGGAPGAGGGAGEGPGPAQADDPARPRGRGRAGPGVLSDRGAATTRTDVATTDTTISPRWTVGKDRRPASRASPLPTRCRPVRRRCRSSWGRRRRARSRRTSSRAPAPPSGPGDRVTAHYIGVSCSTGKIFDSSY